MDRIWTPWRYAYIKEAAGTDEGECIFCAKPKGSDDAANLIVKRFEHCYVILNAFPYTSGHVMVMPYAHLDFLAKLPTETAHELIELAQRTERVLNKAYSPHGFNFGLNLGHAAGAGVAGHLHLHAMPRWTGDTNFMTTVGETRVLPEDLQSTFKRLRQAIKEVE